MKARISIERTRRLVTPRRHQSNFEPREKSSFSGGAFNTPQLLMLSGIGPKEELQRHGIAVNIDLPGVGKNLQDRYEVGIVYKLKENLSTLANAKFEANEQTDPVYKEWKEATPEERRDGKGFLYSSNGVIIADSSAHPLPKMPNESPDLFIFGLPSDFRGYEQGVHEEHHDQGSLHLARFKGPHPQCGGEVTLRSNDPRNTPTNQFQIFRRRQRFE